MDPDRAIIVDIIDPGLVQLLTLDGVIVGVALSRDRALVVARMGLFLIPDDHSLYGLFVEQTVEGELAELAGRHIVDQADVVRVLAGTAPWGHDHAARRPPGDLGLVLHHPAELQPHELGLVGYGLSSRLQLLGDLGPVVADVVLSHESGQNGVDIIRRALRPEVLGYDDPGLQLGLVVPGDTQVVLALGSNAISQIGKLAQDIVHVHTDQPGEELFDLGRDRSSLGLGGVEMADGIGEGY